MSASRRRVAWSKFSCRRGRMCGVRGQGVIQLRMAGEPPGLGGLHIGDDALISVSEPGPDRR